MIKAPTVNYLNNKDILKEIHKSKLSFCYLEDEKYGQHDLILKSVDDITKSYTCKHPDLYSEDGLSLTKKSWSEKRSYVQDAKENQAKRFRDAGYAAAMLVHDRTDYKNKPKQKEFYIDPASIANKLGKMYLKLVDKYSHRANWRGYTYVDEMRGMALVQLSYIGLQFNEDKSDNPFAYYTAVITNSFRKVLLLEKKNQGIRDDILVEQGHLPSYTRQLKHEEEVRELRAEAEESDNQVNG